MRLLVGFILLCVIVHPLIASQSSAKCIRLSDGIESQRTWVVAENAMNGLSNQLFGIYSYIPVAILWNVSMVVGPVYSRPSFKQEVQKYKGWNAVPFSQFFDWNFFVESWLPMGVHMVEQNIFKRSCLIKSLEVKTVVREPHFWPNKDLIINQMLSKSSIPLPITEGSLIKFDEKYPKFTALYNYWKGGLKNKVLLIKVHNSLRPAANIQRLIDAMLVVLPKTFFAAHIRLEGKRKGVSLLVS
jgi:hypothetical protein